MQPNQSTTETEAGRTAALVGPGDLFCASLEWHKGPAEGGQGTAGKNEDGVPQWWDGDRLLIIVETSDDREIAVVDINADEDYFDVRDASTGDTYDAWGPECWSWWAKLTKHNLPQNTSSEPCPPPANQSLNYHE